MIQVKTAHFFYSFLSVNDKDKGLIFCIHIETLLLNKYPGKQILYLNSIETNIIKGVANIINSCNFLLEGTYSQKI